MAGERGVKQRKQAAPKTAKMASRAGEKKRPNEELGPERRVELARQAQARESRGKPPSI
jgi:hypothetical protein